MSSEKNIVIQSNLYKMTTLGTTQKQLCGTGACPIKQLQTKSGSSWEGFSFYSHCERFLSNKNLLE